MSALRLSSSYRTRPKDGENENGDIVVVNESAFAGGALYAVVDALGHGAEAAAVARRSATYLSQPSLPADIRALMLGLHGALRGSRGAAATVCVVRAGTITACGVGNVEMRARGSSIPFALSPGILGTSCSTLRTFSHSIAAADRIALFSDGVRRTLSLETAARFSLAQAAETLFQSYATNDDDATLLLIEAHA